MAKHDDRTLCRALAALGEEREADERCPSPEWIWEAARGGLELDERLTYLDHTTTCAHCAEVWRLAFLMGARPPGFWRALFGDARRSLSKLWERPRLLVPITAITLLLVMAVPVAHIMIDTPMPASTFRGVVEQVDPEKPLTREDSRLRWSGPEGALYDLVVMDSSAEPLVIVDGLETSEYELRQENLEELASGEYLYWKVDVTLPNGERRESQTFISRLQ